MSPDDAPAPRAPARALRLDLLRELPDDGAGAWLGRDRISGATREVRTLRLSELDGSDDAAIEAAVARLGRLAAALADVDDPRVLPPVAAWPDGEGMGTVTVATAHAPGVALRDALRGAGGLDAARVAVILADVGRALATAHQRGVVHGDVRPEHVRLADDGSGVARLSGFERRAVLGDGGIAEQSPPAYQSPEQLDGRVPDARADVHALGVLGWELLTGRRPWSGEPLAAVVERQRLDALPSLAVLCPDAPRGLVATLERAMLKDPARRWPDAGAFADALERVRGFAQDEAVTGDDDADDAEDAVGAALPAARAVRTPRRPRPERHDATAGWGAGQRGRLAILALGLLAILGVSALFVTREQDRTRRNALYLDSLQRGISTGELFDTAPAPDTAPPVVRRPRPRPVVVAPPVDSAVAGPLAPVVPPSAAPAAPAESTLPPLPAEPPRARVRLDDSARADTTPPPGVAPAPPPTTPPPADSGAPPPARGALTT